MQHAFSDLFLMQQPTPTWQLSLGGTGGPTDINSIPKELSDHTLYGYVHNNCKISLFCVQNNLYSWPTKTSKLHTLPHMSDQSLVNYNPVVGLMGLTLDEEIEQHLTFNINTQLVLVSSSFFSSSPWVHHHHCQHCFNSCHVKTVYRRSDMQLS